MPKEVNFIVATDENCSELATFNKDLIDSGGSYNTMSIQELEKRMSDFLASGYIAIIFEVEGVHIGYALVAKNEIPMFIRHYFIVEKYRRQGYGTAAFKKLLCFLRVDRIDLSVLVSNDIGFKFWTSCGLVPYEVFMHYRGDGIISDK